MAVLVIEFEAKGARVLPDDDGRMRPREVELNANWYAPFLQRRVRGRFDYARCIDRDGKALAHDLPSGGVPGQMLMIDTEKKTGSLLEPLHADQFAALRRKLVKMYGREREAMVTPNPLGLDEPEQKYELNDGRDVATWLYWMKRAVESGNAKVVKGELPAKIDGKPRKQFFTPEPGPDRNLEAERERQALQLALLTPEQRKVYEAELKRLKGT